ncbi:MAG: hypothetical protein PHX58_02045 [Desulfovibrio sp.]|jgi:hypothetical protein|nr:hypothetical protein [Desulfovibrio sp.]
MIGELIHGMAQSTTQGFIGVSLIFIYLVWIVSIAMIRIKETKQEEHH